MGCLQILIGIVLTLDNVVKLGQDLYADLKEELRKEIEVDWKNQWNEAIDNINDDFYLGSFRIMERYAKKHLDALDFCITATLEQYTLTRNVIYDEPELVLKKRSPRGNKKDREGGGNDEISPQRVEEDSKYSEEDNHGSTLTRQSFTSNASKLTKYEDKKGRIEEEAEDEGDITMYASGKEDSFAERAGEEGTDKK
mmetsp:Transcript_56667/g.64687  ORF Transcript_56667/g.64687 Transcript_56667/m.64687 type:complete len:197 (-) Transcript_56667:8-598(-)